MKPIHNFLLAGISGLVLPMAANAAPVSWSAPTAITGATDITTSGLIDVAGANFGITNGTTTLVNNGSVDIEFKSLRSGESATLANGLTVNAASAWGNFGPGPNTAITGDFGDVLGSNLGIEGEAGPMSADITLSGLTIGTQYQIQFFADSTGTNDQTISGSASMNSLSGQFVTGTFTADGTSQVLTVTRNTDFGVANALTIGAFAPADTTPPSWTATWPQVDSLSPTSLTVRAKTNETGKTYYVVLPDGAPAPSAAQVKAGTDSSNAAASAAGNITLTANIEATAPVSGLTAATHYDVYFVAEDVVPNLQASPSLVNASTESEPATVTWGAVTTPVDESSIVTTGVTGIVGANFAKSAVSPLTANGVTFTAVTLNSSANIGGGITVATSGMNYTNLNTGISDVTGTFGSVVMDSHTGILSGTGTITLSGLVSGTQYQIQFFASTNDTNALANQTITGGAGTSAAFGSHVSGSGKTLMGTFTAVGTTQRLTITGGEAAANALTIGVVSTGNTFANWIGGYDVGSLTAFGDDADSDGLDNGLENFLGTAPDAGNAGLTAGTLSGDTFTFTHPQNATPASDVSAPVYSWSTDLVNWNATGASSGGITVNLAADTNNPSAGTTTVTATVIGTVPQKLFVRLGVSQN